MAQVLRVRIAEEAAIEPRTRSYAFGDTIRIRFSFQFTGEADLSEEILVVFAQAGSDGTIALEGTISKIAVVPRQEAPGESITYEATVSGLVADVEPGEYRCSRIVIIDEEGPAWPFTDVA